MALKFELVTPARLERTADVHMVTVPGAEGDFSVLEGHAPFMATLRNGPLTIYATAGAAPEVIEVEGGFAGVNERGLTDLAELIAGSKRRRSRLDQKPASSPMRAFSCPRGKGSWH